MLSFCSREQLVRKLPHRRHRIRRNRKLVENGEVPYKFAYARTALKYGLRHLGIAAGDTILIPDFVCNNLLEPLETLGIQPIYYPVTRTLEPNWKVLKEVVGQTTRALIMVHYFGQPQNIPEFQEYCYERSIFLIEDNAHGYGGVYQGQSLGTFGDIAITAPRKNVPLYNGALLYIKNGKLNPTSLSGLKAEPINRLLQIKKFLRQYINKKPIYHLQSSSWDPFLEDWGLDEATYRYMLSLDIRALRSKRQMIYNLWQNWAGSMGLTPIFLKLSPGAMPLVFGAYTQSHEESREWFDWGFQQGIDIHSWPNLPHELAGSTGNAMDLWKRIICFPIHQEMDFAKLSVKLQRLSKIC
jgi:perosamine synthetase